MSPESALSTTVTAPVAATKPLPPAHDPGDAAGPDGPGGPDRRRPGRPAAGLLRLLPGLGLCAAATALAMLAARVIPYVGAVLIAIILGIVLRNALPAIPSVLQPGIDVAAKTLLRAGIVLLGFRLALGDVLALGWGAVVIIVAVVTIGFSGTVLMGRMLGVPRGLSLLIGAGFSICGAAAVAGAESTLRSKKEDVTAAVALVVLFGTAMIGIVPATVHLLGLDPRIAGVWAGASTHEVGQVAAIGQILGPEALKTATLVKLGRVVLLAPMMIVLGGIVSRSRARQLNLRSRARRSDPRSRTRVNAPDSVAADPSDSAGTHRPPIMPLWVAGFIVATAIATTGVLPGWFTGAASTGQSLLLTAAMFGLGCGVHVKSLLRLGLRPVLLAFLATCLVSGTAGLGVWLLA